MISQPHIPEYLSPDNETSVSPDREMNRAGSSRPVEARRGLVVKADSPPGSMHQVGALDDAPRVSALGRTSLPHTAQRTANDFRQ